MVLQIHPSKMRDALTMDMLATDLADYLVRKGVGIASLLIHECAYIFRQIPFRETHHISGRAVALAESRKVQISDLSLEDLRELCERFEPDVKDVFDFEASVEKRDAIGGTSKRMVERQVRVLREILRALNSART
jgi:argininosuccinate lyase